MSPEPRASDGRMHLWIVWSVLTIVLFLGFFDNFWGVVNPERFRDFQKDSESLVMARLAESRQSNLTSYNGLLGWADADPVHLTEDDYQHQYDVYLKGEGFESYSLYKSSSGGQALLLGLLDGVSPVSRATNLTLFRALVSVLMAGTISLFITWIAQEFGFFVAAFAAIASVASQWITLFGRNLFYFIWASFLPLVLVAWYLAKESRRGAGSDLGPAMVAGATILFKCITNGFDFILPALATPLAPFIYYASRDQWEPVKILRRSLFIALGLTIAVAASILLLAVQLQISEGSLGGGLASIFGTLGRRTYYVDAAMLPDYAAAVESTPWTSVLWTYLARDTAIEVLGFSFLDLIGVSAAATAAYLLLYRMHPDWLADIRKTLALIVVTWLSVLSPVSWFLLFKGQAVVHTHTNYLAWHMPFAFFAFAMIAWLALCIARGLRRGALLAHDRAPGAG